MLQVYTTRWKRRDILMNGFAATGTTVFVVVFCTGEEDDLFGHPALPLVPQGPS